MAVDSMTTDDRLVVVHHQPSQQPSSAVSAPQPVNSSDGGADSEEWEPTSSSSGQANSLDDCEEDSFEDHEESYGLQFCTNCTSRVYGSVCEDCGHHTDMDSDLFQPSTVQSSPSWAQSGSQPVALLWDERMTLHEEGKVNPHPERPDRLKAVVARILSSGLNHRCRRVTCREATTTELATVHTAELIKFVERVALGDMAQPGAPLLMTPDTYANQHTSLCARLAAGGAAEVAGLVAAGNAQHGAAIVRPPGHHAESGMAMGFCFFNNAAVAAKAAQAKGAKRVLILDWDIHHGNGTQHIFEEDNSVMYMSLHRYDGGRFYPGTGAVDEVGRGHGAGFTVNIPWDARDMSNGDYLSAFNHVLIPVAYEFNPDLIIVSAGFDAAEGDPIGECRLTPECYGHMTAMLKAVAPVVLILEGGYNLKSTATSTEACLRVLLGEQPCRLPGNRFPSIYGLRAIQSAIRVQSQYWKCLRPAATALLCQSPGVTWQTGVQQLQSSLLVASGAVAQERVEVPASSHLEQQTRPTNELEGGSSRGKRSRSQLHTFNRKQEILVAIHRRAMRAFWKRQRRLAKQHKHHN